MSRIVVREAALGERDRILRIALTEPNAGMQQARQVCQMTQSYLQRCGGSVGALHLAESAGHVLTVCAALDLPGRVSLLVVPPWSLAKSSLGVLPDVLAAGSAAADQRGMRFAQILLDPELSWRIEPYLLAVGFSHLASLDYMQRNAFDPVVIRPVEQVVWRTLPEAGEVALADVILHTYIGSRDCPALTGIRTMEEILASHRGAGEFDPDGWYLLQHRGRDVGVLRVYEAWENPRPSLESTDLRTVSIDAGGREPAGTPTSGSWVSAMRPLLPNSGREWDAVLRIAIHGLGDGDRWNTVP